MLDDDQRDAARVHRAQQIERLVDLGRIEAGHHFIEQQHFGIERERLRDFETLAIGNREVACGPVADARETDDLEQFLRVLERRCRVERFPPSRPYIAPTATFSRTLKFANGLTI